MLSAGAWLWFLGSLRSYLLRAEGGTGTLSTAAFGAGFVGIVVQVLIQAPQSALAMASSGNVEPGLALVMANMAYAFNVIAYVPLAVMLVAVALGPWCRLEQGHSRSGWGGYPRPPRRHS